LLATADRAQSLAGVVAAVAAGETAALAELYDSTVAKVHTLVQAIVRSATDAEEVTCDVLRSTDGTWTDFCPGVRLKILDEDPSSSTRTYLVSMESGAIVPEHPHSLEEQCLVLEGEVWVGDHPLRSGDWHVAKPVSHHGNFSTRTGCLLLIKSEVFPGP